MKIFSVTVTYSNRFHLLKQVIDASLREGVYRVIVIDNNSDLESRRKLIAYESENINRVKVIYLDENTGSAGGYKRGLEEACKDANCEFILILDDDNLLTEGSLKKLVDAYNYLVNEAGDPIMLNMFRAFQKLHVQFQDGLIKTYEFNNYIAFNFLKRVKMEIKRVFFSPNTLNHLPPLVPEQVGAYGGLFMPRSVVDLIGFPNERLIVYTDDQEYTLRFTRKFGKLYLCTEAKIVDLDITYPNCLNINPIFSNEVSDFKIYYSMRNHTYFSKQFITNKFYFYGNFSLKVLLTLLTSFFKCKDKKMFMYRAKLYLRAIKDGYEGRLGKTL